MFDDELISALTTVGSVLIVLVVQFLLCFKVINLLLKLLPLILLTASTALLFTLMYTVNDLSAIGYLVLFIFSGALLCVDGLVWGIYAITKLIRKKSKR